MESSPFLSRRRLVAVLGAVLAAVLGAAAVIAGPMIAGGRSPILAPLLAANAEAGCSDIETIAIRGTTEPQGGGIVAGPLASALQNQLDESVQTHNLVYPASFNYTASKRQGVQALRDRLARTSAACPDISFVLIGYSQGADVIGDTLQAGNVPAADRIDAVAMFGDPAFNSREDFVTGNFRPGTNGIFPRRTGALDEFADEIVSFCNPDDTFCQRGASGAGHFRYGADRQEAVDAVEALLG